MKVVVDTNVLMSGIFWGGIPGKVVESWVRQEIRIVISPEILQEYENVLSRLGKKLKQDQSILNTWNQYFFRFCEIRESKPWKKICRDKDDQKFLDIAFSAEVSFLISGDQDLLVLKSEFPIPIVKPSEFLKGKK